MITAFRGKRKIVGCPACFHHQMERRVFMNQQIWMGREAYGDKKLAQMNRDWIDGAAKRAAKQRKDTGCISGAAFDYLVSESKAGRIHARRT